MSLSAYFYKSKRREGTILHNPATKADIQIGNYISGNWELQRFMNSYSYPNPKLDVAILDKDVIESIRWRAEDCDDFNKGDVLSILSDVLHAHLEGYVVYYASSY